MIRYKKKNLSSLLLRCTIKVVHILIDGRDSDSVEFALREIKLEWGDCLRTITTDTGPEFSTLNKAFEDTDTDIFYAHSYTSCDRGSNEAHNRMIRRDYQKGESLDDVSPSQVLATQDRLNGLPRRKLDYRGPQECFETEVRRTRSSAQHVS